MSVYLLRRPLIWSVSPEAGAYFYLYANYGDRPHKAHKRVRYIPPPGPARRARCGPFIANRILPTLPVRAGENRDERLKQHVPLVEDTAVTAILLAQCTLFIRITL